MRKKYLNFVSFEDEQDQRLKFRVYEQYTAVGLWTRSSSEQENVVGFNGFQEEDEQGEDEQKEWRMKMKQ